MKKSLSRVRSLELMAQARSLSLIGGARKSKCPIDPLSFVKKHSNASGLLGTRQTRMNAHF
jgi:hypothetical protein